MKKYYEQNDQQKHKSNGQKAIIAKKRLATMIKKASEHSKLVL